MLNVIITLLRSLLSAFRGRKNLVAENLALRHQLMVIQRQLKRPQLTNADHIIVINEAHFRRIQRAYLVYYHRSRTHMGLDNDCPIPRAVQPPETGQVFATPVLGGLHKEYRRFAA